MAQTLTARSPEDLLALVPVVLGFVPQDSAVMLTFGSARPFHARVDLPPSGADHVPEMVSALLAPASRHGVERVAFVLYSDDALPAERVSRRLVRAFREQGIEVVDVLRADGRRWFPMLRHRGWAPAAGVPYDVSTHPFLAQAVLDGRVTHPSRSALAASLAPDPDRVARVEAARAGQPGASPAWVAATVGRHAGAGTSPTDDEAARLLVAVGSDLDARDAAWSGLRRGGATGHVELWADVLRRAPGDLCASPAAILAMAAWVAGHGALAWCAVDRAEAAAPGHSLARLVGDLLAAAVPPSDWEEVFLRQDPA